MRRLIVLNREMDSFLSVSWGSVLFLYQHNGVGSRFIVYDIVGAQSGTQAYFFHSAHIYRCLITMAGCDKMLKAY